MNRRYISTTDPEASLVRRIGGQSKLEYKTHRAVDAGCGVITATEVTTGSINEAHRLTALVDQHHENTRIGTEVAVADSQYGTKGNYYACHDRGIKAHMPDLKGCHDQGSRRAGIFPAEAFTYDQESDTYICPAGQCLKKHAIFKDKGCSDYRGVGSICRACPLRSQCTRSKSARSVQREDRQDVLDAMRKDARSESSKKDIRTRQHFMERSFAQGTRYGLKRCRWRGLWRVKIQDYLIATVQNLDILMAKGQRLRDAGAERLRAVEENGVGFMKHYRDKMFSFLSSLDCCRLSFEGLPCKQ